MANNGSVVALFGPCGAGKESQAKFLIHEHGFYPESPDMGAIIREGCQKSDPYLTRLNVQYASRGLRVPDSEMKPVFSAALQKIPLGERWISDGYMRSSEQFKHLVSCAQGRGDDLIVIHLARMSPTDAWARLSKRRRVDDNEAGVYQRYAEQYALALPDIVRQSQHLQITIYEVDARAQPDDVSAEIEAILYSLGIISYCTHQRHAERRVVQYPVGTGG